MMDKIVQVHIFYHESYLMRFDVIKIQISLNVMKTMVAVVRHAPTLKEALNVPVERAMYSIMMDKIVQVHIFDHG